MATVKGKKADVSSVSPSSERSLNPVVNTKLPAILSHRRSTSVSLETYPFIKVSSLIQITDGINVLGFEIKVDLKIVRNTSGHYQEKFRLF